MTQPIANEQLSAYLDGELSDVERDELEKALAEDPALRQELARLEKAVAFFKQHGPVQAPRGFHDKVLAAVANEPMPGWWWRWLRRPFGIPIEGFAVALAAAMVLLVALPFGLKTASKSGMELPSDPFGYVRGEETRSAPGAMKGSETIDKEQEAAPADEPAVADLQDQGGEGEVPDAMLAAREGTDLRAAAKPSARATPSEPVVVSGTTEVDGTAPVAGTAPIGGMGSTNAPPTSADSSGYGSGYVQAPAQPGVLLKYDVLTYDEDALVQLQRIAAKYRGVVADASGSSSKTLSLESGHTYLVEIPASALAAFGDDLHELGMVTENADPRKWAGDTVKVQVTFQVMPSNSSRALKAAPTATEAQ